jgi:hypothetical protein
MTSWVRVPDAEPNLHLRMNNMLLTSSDRVKHTDYYKKIKTILERMDASGVIWMGRGNCVSMSDVMVTALKQAGIDCSMVECQMMFKNNNKNHENEMIVGFDGQSSEGQLDTHVVVITKTEIPLVIDASIAHLLSNGYAAVVDELVNNPNRIFCDINYSNFKLTYQQKTYNKVIFEYQKSILDRIETDRKIFDNIKILKYLIVFALTVSTLNAGRGFYDFYNRYLNDEKLVGLSANEEIIERLIKLENKLKNR